MRPSAILGVAGAVAVAAVGVVSLLPSGQTVAADIVRDRVTCVAGPTQVCDAFETGGAGAVRYRRVEAPSQDCTIEGVLPDGGVASSVRSLRPANPKSGMEIVLGSCVDASSVAGARTADAGVSFLAQACACRRAGGVCQYAADGGALVTAPFGKTLGPGYPPYENWSGAGCQPKACVELAGNSSWPTQCPTR